MCYNFQLGTKNQNRIYTMTVLLNKKTNLKKIKIQLNYISFLPNIIVFIQYTCLKAVLKSANHKPASFFFCEM